MLYRGSVDLTPRHARHAAAIDDVRQDVVAQLTREACADEFNVFPLDQYLPGPLPPFALWGELLSGSGHTRSVEGGAAAARISRMRQARKEARSTRHNPGPHGGGVGA